MLNKSTRSGSEFLVILLATSTILIPLGLNQNQIAIAQKQQQQQHQQQPLRNSTAAELQQVPQNTSSYRSLKEQLVMAWNHTPFQSFFVSFIEE
jgi:hypothetical protein